MARSASYDFALTGDQLWTSVLRLMGAFPSGTSPSPEDLAACREAGNMIIKQWSGNTNRGIRGFKAFQRSRTSLTLSASSTYTLKYATLAFTSGGTTQIVAGNTITGATSTATATVVSVTTTSGTWAGGDAAGTLTLTGQTGTFASENLNVGASLNVASISGNSDQAGGGKDIYPPTNIVTVTLKDTSGNEKPLAPMLLEDYEYLPNKTNTGDPGRYFYERGVNSGILYLDAIPSDTTKVLDVVYMAELDDIDGASDSVWFPKEWLRALKFATAVDIAPEYDQNPATLMALRNEAIEFATSFEPENINLQFLPEVY